MRNLMLAGVAAAALAGSVQAAGAPHPQAETQALDLAERAIALRSVAGPGNQTPQVAALYRQALVEGGFPADQAVITPVGDTAYLIARWPGTDRSLKPLVINGHMDVVEAKPADWTRDPFKPVVENGYLFGRGATDMKLSGTLAIAAVLELKREGYRPRRDIVFAFSGDEETTMRTGSILAEKLSGAQMMLNMDGGGGVLNEKTGAPEYFTWKTAEKTYADYHLTVVNPGGHSSEPRRPNAIDELAAGLLRIQDHVFTPELSPVTRAYFEQAAKYERPGIAAAMRAFAANPADAQAIAALRAEPSMIGKIGTTCVVTEISGGHALNALPQRAEANINCRIFPGHPRPAIMAELQQVAGDPAIAFKDVTEGSVATDASPLDPAVASAVGHALEAAYPGAPVFPSMSSGASDSMWFRYRGVESYNISPVFTKASENFSHGLNERTPVADIGPSITYCLSLFRSLSQ